MYFMLRIGDFVEVSSRRCCFKSLIKWMPEKPSLHTSDLVHCNGSRGIVVQKHHTLYQEFITPKTSLFFL
jgi:hypothetical protein